MYIPKANGTSRVMTVVNSMNDGVTIAGIPAIILLNYTLGYAIEAAPSFELIQNFFLNMPGPALFALCIMAILLLGAAASAAGMLIAAVAAAQTFIPVMGVDPDAAFLCSDVINNRFRFLAFCRCNCRYDEHYRNQIQGRLSSNCDDNGTVYIYRKYTRYSCDVSFPHATLKLDTRPKNAPSMRMVRFFLGLILLQRHLINLKPK